MGLKTKLKDAGGAGGAAGFVSNLSIRTKILGGFSVVLTILAAVAVNSYFSFASVATGVEHYSASAEEAALAAKIETRFLKLQTDVREYANLGDAERAKAVEARAPKMQNALDLAKKSIHDPTHLAKVDEIATAFAEFMSMYTKMRAVKGEHDQLVKSKLLPDGDKIVKDIDAIIEDATKNGNSNVSILARNAHEHGQMLRLYAQIMEGQSDEEFKAKVETSLHEFAASLAGLKKNTTTEKSRALVAEMETLFANFQTTFEKAHKDEVEIHHLVQKEMVEKAHTLIENAEFLETVAAENEQAVRAETNSTVVFGEIVIVIVSLAGLGLGLVMAFVLGRMISNPISHVTEIMEELSQGNSDMEITDIERADEIGAMNRALVELRRSVKEAYELSQMVEDMPINVMKCDLDNFTINYMNKSTRTTLKTLESILPTTVDKMIGQSIDIFHKHPEHQRTLLRDPKNLPHKANIKLGDETLNLNVTAIRDQKGNYIGPMLSWSVITEQLALSEKVLNVVKNVSAAATEMRSAAESMTATAESTSKQSTAVAAASEEAATNVQTVASAAEELSVSVSEINRQVGQSTEVANKANQEAERTNATVQGLAEAAQKIGEVVSLISEIAEQTNLLALNATIEAARAGEAGKGFAVVASEVKNLANQTAKATEDIATQVSEMQSVTGDAVTAIKTISETISEINSITDLIATAVNEQGKATAEIAENTQQASAGTQEVNRNISGVTQGAQETGASATQVLSAADELSKQAEALSMEVQGFMDKIKAA